MEQEELRPWKIVSKRTVYEHRFLTLESHEVELPDGEVIPDWPWVIIPDAVNVIAETVDGDFLCFRQTKYAVEGTTLAPVGGMMDPGEDPLEAAQRELLEETGYIAAAWSSLGSYRVGPNRGIHIMHLYLAQGAKRVAEPDSDDLEDQQLLRLSRAELESALDGGEFKMLAWAMTIALALRLLDKKK